MALAARPQGFDPHRGTGLGAYLAGIARHHWLALRRGQGPGLNAGGDEPTATEHLPADEASPEQLLVQRQTVAGVHAALARLPWVFREAVVLVDLQGRAYAEAAEIAGCELNTLRTRLHRGRARLADLLRPVAGEA
jgi:RNA polymerase sigma-70 factor (ECF subfamily)